MNRRIAAALALVAWAALLLQLWLSLHLGAGHGKSVGASLLVYFGYFTVLTNLFVALVATAGATCAADAWDPALYRPQVVGCATTGILLVGIVYHTLLRQEWSPQGAQWLADTLLHYVVPAIALLHWLVYRPRQGLDIVSPLRWSLYPLAYCLYVVVRGELIGSYPYPFIDVGVLGYPRALLHALALLALFIALGMLVLALAAAADCAATPSPRGSGGP